MIDINTVITLIMIGIISLILTIFLILNSNKTGYSKISGEEVFKIELFNHKISIILILYSAIVIILFLIGIFSDFILNSIIGLVFASIPIFADLISSYKRKDIKEV